MARYQDRQHLRDAARQLQQLCTDYPRWEGATFVTDPAARNILNKAAKLLCSRAAELEQLDAEADVARANARLAAAKKAKRAS